MTPKELLNNPNIRAFLRAIRLGEGTSDEAGYRRIVGGELFSDFRDHPRKRVFLPRYNVWSTAAGAYQFIASTWDEMRAAYALPDFSPSSQDQAAVGLLIRRKAVQPLLDGDVERAIFLCREEWASLPGSPYGQRTENKERVLAEYRKWGGQERLPAAPVEQPPAPIVESQPAIVSEKPDMSPIITAVLPQIIAAIPDLTRVFGSGSATAERNAQAAEKVVQIVQAATESVNAQQAAEKVATDPDARNAAIEAIRQEYAELLRISEQSVSDARKFAQEWSGDELFINTERFNMRFIEFLSLVLIAISAGGAWYAMAMDNISPEFKGSIITLMLIAGYTGVREFWFGSTRESERKTQMLGE